MGYAYLRLHSRNKNPAQRYQRFAFTLRFRAAQRDASSWHITTDMALQPNVGFRGDCVARQGDASGLAPTLR